MPFESVINTAGANIRDHRNRIQRQKELEQAQKNRRGDKIEDWGKILLNRYFTHQDRTAKEGREDELLAEEKKYKAGLLTDEKEYEAGLLSDEKEYEAGLLADREAWLKEYEWPQQIKLAQAGALARAQAEDDSFDLGFSFREGIEYLKQIFPQDPTMAVGPYDIQGVDFQKQADVDKLNSAYLDWMSAEGFSSTEQLLLQNQFDRWLDLRRTIENPEITDEGEIGFLRELILRLFDEDATAAEVGARMAEAEEAIQPAADFLGGVGADESQLPDVNAITSADIDDPDAGILMALTSGGAGLGSNPYAMGYGSTGAYADAMALEPPEGVEPLEEDAWTMLQMLGIKRAGDLVAAGEYKIQQNRLEKPGVDQDAIDTVTKKFNKPANFGFPKGLDEAEKPYWIKINQLLDDPEIKQAESMGSLETLKRKLGKRGVDVEVLQDIQMLFNKYYGPDRPDVDTNPYSEGNLTGLY